MNHTTKIEKIDNASAVYNYLITCTCQFQGRAFNKEEAEAIAARHELINNRKYV